MTARYVPEPTRPLEMSGEHWQIIQRLREDIRTRVLERSSIIHEATGCDWSEADERALAEEAGIAQQTKLVGT